MIAETGEILVMELRTMQLFMAGTRRTLFGGGLRLAAIAGSLAVFAVVAQPAQAADCTLAAFPDGPAQPSDCDLTDQYLLDLAKDGGKSLCFNCPSPRLRSMRNRGQNKAADISE